MAHRGGARWRRKRRGSIESACRAPEFPARCLFRPIPKGRAEGFQRVSRVQPHGHAIVAQVTTLPIVQIGHPALRQRAREVPNEQFDTPELRRICADLVETMRAANGAGLAAPQVDIPMRIFAVEVGDNPRYPYKPRLGLRVLVNPVVRPVSEETYQSYEGCLSIPDLRGLLTRHTEVDVTYLDPDGSEHVERFGGPSAGTMQHELDHLDGVLFPDRVHDPTTFCTWAMFRTYHEEAWVESIQPLLARFPGEPGTS